MDEAYLAHLHDLFGTFGAITTRAMFGGHGLYHDGLIIGIVIDEMLYLKVDEQSKADFVAAGCSPFVYLGQKKLIEMSYWSLPEEAMDAPEVMRPWALRAYAAALRKVAAPKKKRRSGTKPPLS